MLKFNAKCDFLSGNLIRYDSIYSWSSNENPDELAKRNRDSLLRTFRSKCYRNFSHIDHQRFGDLFSGDSLFTKRYFDDDFFDSDFGEEFMDMDRIRKRMETMQQRFLERYQSANEKFINEPSQDGSWYCNPKVGSYFVAII